LHGSNRRHIPSLAALTEAEAKDLASTLGAISRRMDNLCVQLPLLIPFSLLFNGPPTDLLRSLRSFKCSFGYSMGVYQAPVHRAATTEAADDWAAYAQLHVGFYPPLLRSSTVKKFLVG
jgi:UDPglucose--hexose-1-phosphate uridylyltransferase